MIRGGFAYAEFNPSPPGMLGGGGLARFRGKGLPSPRTVNRKQKAKNRRRRFLANEQHRHMKG